MIEPTRGKGGSKKPEIMILIVFPIFFCYSGLNTNLSYMRSIKSHSNGLTLACMYVEHMEECPFVLWIAFTHMVARWITLELCPRYPVGINPVFEYGNLSYLPPLYLPWIRTVPVLHRYSRHASVLCMFYEVAYTIRSSGNFRVKNFATLQTFNSHSNTDYVCWKCFVCLIFVVFGDYKRRLQRKFPKFMRYAFR